ncbi:MAG: TrkH family potassium uptake protein [Firmicutes bacterium]|nr:TrkH family potassium uptake protein [Bacillota bacterium]
MNYSLIFYIVGWMLDLEALMMCLSGGVAIFYHEPCAMPIFVTALLCFILGSIMIIKKPSNREFSLKEGYLSVSLCWIILSLTGMLPFLLSGAIPDPVNAFFETVSGFTTTGSSILTDIESMPHGLLFWRSFTHWIGGMGVLVLVISVIPLVGGTRMNLMKAESPGPSVTRILPTAKNSARILYVMYFAMSAVQVILLLITGMPAFDSITITFGTAGTGGFGVSNASCADYTAVQQVIITVFMILFGINFNAYFFIIRRNWKDAFGIEEIRYYLLVIVLSTVVIATNIKNLYGSMGESLRQSFFQVGSIITTTGFCTTDYNQWPALSCTILVLLMFLGACSGSTGGGIKICRIVVLAKAIRREVRSYIYPGAVTPIRLDGKRVNDALIRSIYSYMAVYCLIFIGSMLFISLDGYDFTTNFTAVATTLNNVGPGLSLVGPVENFAFFSAPSRFVLALDMLIGRLEIFPFLMLFIPNAWKKF